MTNMTVSRLGQVNQSGDNEALFLKKYAGMVLPAFDEKNIATQLHMVQNLSSGKSFQFPVFGKKTASYHTPGEKITGNKMNHGERTILIDGKLISDSFIADIDEMKNHYETMSEYAKQDGAALARHFDKNVFRKFVLGARASATVTDGYGGLQLTNAAYGTTATTLAAGIADAGLNFDEKDVPEEDRFAVVKPAQYHLLWQATDLVNKDWDGNGSISKGKIMEYGGIPILKSNNIPTSNDTSNNDIPSGYRADFSSTVAIVGHKTAVGTAKLQDIRFEKEYDMSRQGTLLVTGMAVGTDYLRPEACVELKSS